jgi:aspartate/methionine/tyrosine aminotransferase
MPRKLPIDQLLEKHEQLIDDLTRSTGPFISDWNGTHPFAQEYIGDALSRPRTEFGRYHFYNEDPDLSSAIARFHRKNESMDLRSTQILAGEGSSTFLAAYSLLLRQVDVPELYYVPPLYYTLHYFLRLLGIRARPISKSHLFDSRALANLPHKKTILVLSDPIWYAGRRVDAQSIAELAEWQTRTRSTIFVDGSFQFMQWDGVRHERTSLLDPDLTFRLICPTKSLGLPMFRFSYLLHPPAARRRLVFLYESLTGATSSPNLRIAHRVMEVLNSDDNNASFSHHLSQTYKRLIRDKLVMTDVEPDCSYFIFAKPMRQHAYVTMDGSYFEQSGYPGYVRINLMSAAKRLITSPARHVSA